MKFVWRLMLVSAVGAMRDPWTMFTDIFSPFPSDYDVKDEESFEYVVVGAGAAGSAAAARLALRGRRVLLVEAGGDPDILSAIPRAAMGLMGSHLDWKYKTISNNVSCLSSIGNACRYSRGKCLGGSTSINYMMYVRGNRRDFDEQGVEGWTWDDVEPYFLRWEGIQNISRIPSSSYRYHNTSGILKIDYFPDPGISWHSRLQEAYEHLGFIKNPDVNGESQIGVSVVPGYVHRGYRMSTARAYLTGDEVKRRLKIAKNTLCTGVIIDDNKVAVGITVSRDSSEKSIRIYAKKEVILCAGTIGNPQILMLSGIGPAEHLRQMRIPVRVDLPVGDNLSDHVLPLMFVLVEGNPFLEAMSAVESFAEFLVMQDGSFASIDLTDVTAFLNTSCYRNKRLRAGADCDLPSLQMVHAYVNRGLLPIGKPMFKNAVYFNDNVIDQLAAVNSKHAFVMFSAVVLQPYSRGTVRLASADPLEPPAITPNMLDDGRDLDEVLRAMEIIEDLMETPPFKSQNATIYWPDFPECPFEKSSVSYKECYGRHMTYAVFHAVGTCSFRTVVDARLKVRGVRRLRVADISVLRKIPRGNTAATAVTIGERVADIVEDDISSEDEPDEEGTSTRDNVGNDTEEGNGGEGSTDEDVE